MTGALADGHEHQTGRNDRKGFVKGDVDHPAHRALQADGLCCLTHIEEYMSLKLNKNEISIQIN